VPRSAVVFDLDSTLADTTHRQSMIPEITVSAKVWADCRPGETQPTWDDYSMKCADDSPIAATIWLAKHFAWSTAEPYDVIIVTGRSDGARELTNRWLTAHGVAIDRLIMRPEGDRTPNAIFKVAALDLLKEEGYEVELFVEDFPKVAEAIAEHHPEIPVLLVNPNYHNPVVGGA
jgi:hypothetical protein